MSKENVTDIMLEKSNEMIKRTRLEKLNHELSRIGVSVVMEQKTGISLQYYSS